MGRRCYVCKVAESQNNGDPLEKISLHRFPANTEKRNIWCALLGLTNNDLAKYSVVCSNHFSTDAFYIKPMNGTRCLKADANPVASLNFEGNTSSSDSESDGQTFSSTADEKPSTSRISMQEVLNDIEEKKPNLHELPIFDSESDGQTFSSTADEKPSTSRISMQEVLNNIEDKKPNLHELPIFDSESDGQTFSSTADEKPSTSRISMQEVLNDIEEKKPNLHELPIFDSESDGQTFSSAADEKPSTSRISMQEVLNNIEDKKPNLHELPISDSESDGQTFSSTADEKPSTSRISMQEVLNDIEEKQPNLHEPPMKKQKLLISRSITTTTLETDTASKKLSISRSTTTTSETDTASETESGFRGKLSQLYVPKKRKRFGYIMELSSEDFENETDRRRNLEEIKRQKIQDRKKIHYLQATVRRLRKRITNLSAKLACLKEK